MGAINSNITLEECLVERATRNRVPLGGTLELLPLCNMNCDMCYVRLNKDELAQKGRIREKQEWLTLARQMKDEGVLFLLLTGGEPLLYPDFQELYKGLLDMGMIVTINTNGTLINEKWADFFAQYKPRRINITLYGKDENTYEKLCHYKEGFKRVVRGIHLLRAKNIDVKLNGSLTRRNKEDLPVLLNIAEKLEVPISIDTYMYPASRERNCVFSQEIRLDAKEAGEKKVEIIKRELGERFGGYCQQIKRLDEHEKVGEVDCGMKCRAGKSSFVVNWQGNITPCVMLQKPSFNVFDEGFSMSWSKLVREVEKIKISVKCITCHRREICPTCAACALLETGSYTGVPNYLCDYTEGMMERATKYVEYKDDI